MKITFLPKTKLGKWSAALMIGFFLFFIILQILVISGQRGPGFNPFLAAAVVPAGICSIASFLTGITAIVKKEERAIFVFLVTLFGFFILFFIIGEFLSPH